MKKFSILLILIQLSSHVLQGRERGTQPTPASQIGTGWDQATWPSPSGFYSAGMSGLVASPSSFNLNLSDYVDTSTQQNTQLSSGTRSAALAATGSAAQLHAQLQQQTETDNARDDVTEPEPGAEL